MTSSHGPRSTPKPATPTPTPTPEAPSGMRAATSGAVGVDAQSERVAPSQAPQKPGDKPASHAPLAWAGPGGGDGASAGGAGDDPARKGRAAAAYAKEGTLETYRTKNPDPAKKDSKAPEDQPGFVPIGDVTSGARRGFQGVTPATEDEALAHYYKLDDGNIPLPEVKALGPGEASRIDPKGKGSARNILHGAMNQSWHFAKEQLAGADATPANKLVMKKLWEYRQWHHDWLLGEVQKTMNTKPVPVGPDGKPGKRPLEEWKAAGSASLTSDIDVNLKGTATEAAVAAFNAAFKADGWDFEAGVVYDVNVYALDFMHSPGVKDGDDLVPQKEGKREKLAVGGINPAHGDGKDAAEQIKEDTADQEIWSLLKIAMYTDPTEWAKYKASVTPADDVGRAHKHGVFMEVELRLKEYQATLIGKMEELTGKKAGAKDPSKGGVAQVQAQAHAMAPAPKKYQEAHGVAENLQMAASNRVYEEKLAAVATMRAELADDIRLYNDNVLHGRFKMAALHEKFIHLQVKELREKLSEASLYSNEAYITDGAINHTVVGLQMERPIKQTKAESMHAVNENLGDTLKELTRHAHEGFGHAVYKAGKYMWRFADAARNMSVEDPAINALYNVGFAIGNTIKGGSGGGGKDPDTQSAELVEQELGYDSVAGVKEFMMDAIARVQKRHDEQHSANPQARGKTVVKNQPPAPTH